MAQRNVMEHYPELYEEPAAVEAARRGSSSLEAQPLGEAEGPRYETLPGALPVGGGSGPGAGAAPPQGGTAAAAGRGVEVHRVPADPSVRNIPAVTGSSSSSTVVEVSETSAESSRATTPEPPPPPRVRPRPGYTCNADGSRMPLGPHVEFKIIDFGSSFFSPDLARATGGFRARRNYERLRRLFEAKKVAFKSDTRDATIEVDTAVGKPAGEGHADGRRRRWHLLPTHLRERVRTQDFSMLNYKTRFFMTKSALFSGAVHPQVGAGGGPPGGAAPGAGALWGPARALPELHRRPPGPYLHAIRPAAGRLWPAAPAAPRRQRPLAGAPHPAHPARQYR